MVEGLRAWWTRANDVEVDLVGVDTVRDPRRVALVDSIKWRQEAPFARADLAALHRAAAEVPGFTERTSTVAVSRTEVTADVAPRPHPRELLAW